MTAYDKNTTDYSGWVENNDGTWSYLIRMHNNRYFLSHTKITKQLAFKCILQGDRKGIINDKREILK